LFHAWLKGLALGIMRRFFPNEFRGFSAKRFLHLEVLFVEVSATLARMPDQGAKALKLKGSRPPSRKRLLRVYELSSLFVGKFYKIHVSI
jgi:hypothetical protein